MFFLKSFLLHFFFFLQPKASSLEWIHPITSPAWFPSGQSLPNHENQCSKFWSAGALPWFLKNRIYWVLIFVPKKTWQQRWFKTLRWKRIPKKMWPFKMIAAWFFPSSWRNHEVRIISSKSIYFERFRKVLQQKNQRHLELPWAPSNLEATWRCVRLSRSSGESHPGNQWYLVSDRTWCCSKFHPSSRNSSATLGLSDE